MTENYNTVLLITVFNQAHKRQKFASWCCSTQPDSEPEPAEQLPAPPAGKPPPPLTPSSLWEPACDWWSLSGQNKAARGGVSPDGAPPSSGSEPSVYRSDRSADCSPSSAHRLLPSKERLTSCSIRRWFSSRLDWDTETNNEKWGERLEPEESRSPTSSFDIKQPPTEHQRHTVTEFNFRDQSRNHYQACEGVVCVQTWTSGRVECLVQVLGFEPTTSNTPWIKLFNLHIGFRSEVVNMLLNLNQHATMPCFSVSVNENVVDVLLHSAAKVTWKTSAS